ncbi:MAG: hypothetical protein A2504_17825 [Bdellovibrionales bacterium RIFOXYD12_FULL_39_22]|nr:MAG: hypothetical protein A2385_15165 [Bdellovibrionales bacterium RIFOXYB1_FULL_39_21]OFZ48561.1 MAG: hypothetical protein A2404_17470 [Bdellovibrionales bacterium RIFOXYC1_FULL_39_130]OFZ76662.1 MAG: hypothetical protein A2560_04835 [Bdellovibrionales bacterium RIFOXYD1_FULL_39_84]OFZ95879.1 MAG: hypothetical protein A2504_17825 [Bdellovibrionales bacterium RIFOXYD12_FULL_39_22]HLE12137.1 hypothetical protein [Bacteriovoracaceae bacterium]
MNDMKVKGIELNNEYKNRNEELGEENKRSNKEGENNSESKDQELQRITVNKSAGMALSFVMDQVNEGFIGGKVNRTQIANWIMIKFREALNDAAVKEIRMEYFDEVAVLESILRQAKESGKVPSEFKSLLQKQMVLDEAPKKKTKKVLTESVIKDDNEI